MTVAIKINFRERLLEKQARIKGKITFTQISDETGTPIKTISSWYRGDIKQIHTGVLERFCQYLDCNVGDLIEIIPDNE